jgi:hypothetical protein
MRKKQDKTDGVSLYVKLCYHVTNRAQTFLLGGGVGSDRLKPKLH